MPFLRESSIEKGIVFDDFGILMASGIIRRLIVFLKSKGVFFHQYCDISEIDSRKNVVKLLRGGDLTFDKLVVCAGYGVAGILDKVTPHGISNIGCTLNQCFVLYVGDEQDLEKVTAKHAWANLGVGGDLWGMPAVEGLPVKLGNGNQTIKVDSLKGSPDLMSIQSDFLADYHQFLPKVKELGVNEIKYNHWCEFSTSDKYYFYRDIAVVTADNGKGFKDAPLTAISLFSKWEKV